MFFRQGYRITKEASINGPLGRFSEDVEKQEAGSRVHTDEWPLLQNAQEPKVPILKVESETWP